MCHIAPVSPTLLGGSVFLIASDKTDLAVLKKSYDVCYIVVAFNDNIRGWLIVLSSPLYLNST